MQKIYRAVTFGFLTSAICCLASYAQQLPPQGNQFGRGRGGMQDASGRGGRGGMGQGMQGMGQGMQGMGQGMQGMGQGMQGMGQGMQGMGQGMQGMGQGMQGMGQGNLELARRGATVLLQQFDANKSNSLEGEELVRLSAWVQQMLAIARTGGVQGQGAINGMQNMPVMRGTGNGQQAGTGGMQGRGRGRGGATGRGGGGFGGAPQ